MTSKSMIELRMEIDMSQAQLAKLIGISQSMVQMIESGQRRPSPEVASGIAEVLNLSLPDMWKMFYTTDKEVG